MSGRAVLFVLGNLLVILGLCLLAPLVVTLACDFPGENGWRGVLAFGSTASVALLVGSVGRRAFRNSAGQVRLREGFAVVTMSWLLMCCVGMVPYLVCGATASPADAFFETMSGFTTTGATIFRQVEVLPFGVQFWRCMTQWLGGMGIVVLSVALLPILGVGGYRLLKAETPGGVAFERERPRITDAAKDLWKLYLFLSAAEFLLLYVSGMSAFDAMCHTFTTMSTGGFSPHTESLAYFASPLIQWIVIVFMFLAGMSFSLHAHLLRRRCRAVIGNPELRLYVALTAGAVLLGLVVVPGAGGSDGWEAHVRTVVFQVVAIGTTTGYATADFDAWPQLMRVVLLLLMFVGGCMGSTAGGMKVARMAVYAKAAMREMRHLISPHAVIPLRVGDKVIEPAIVANILGFGFVWCASLCAGTVVMAACDYDLTTSLSAAAAALGNIGPGLGGVGPVRNWAHLPDAAKWFMSGLMLLGRLELFSVLVLFTPWVWRR